MSGSAWALLLALVGPVLGGLAWLIRWGLKNTRSTPEGQLTLAQAWQLTNGSLASEVARLHSQVEHLVTDGTTKGGEIRSLQQEATRIRDDFTTVVREVRPIVEWIDSGAMPPPPSVSLDLRRLLDDAPD